MDKIDMLLIRACKSINPEKRINSVYRRFYHNELPSAETISLILVYLLKYAPMKSIDIINELNPNKYFDEDKRLYWNRVKSMLISNFRFYRKDKLPPDML